MIEVTMTRHFHERWGQRLGGQRFSLPVEKIVACLRGREGGKTRVRLPGNVWLVVLLTGSRLDLITLWVGAWTRPTNTPAIWL